MRRLAAGTLARVAGTVGDARPSPTPAGPAGPPPGDTGSVPTDAGDPGWRALPPLMRAVSTGPLQVADLPRFTDRLATYRDPTLRTPLDHLVSDQAPLGVVHDLARPRPARPDAGRGPAPQLPAVQRRGAGLPAGDRGAGYPAADPATGGTPAVPTPVPPLAAAPPPMSAPASTSAPTLASARPLATAPEPAAAPAGIAAPAGASGLPLVAAPKPAGAGTGPGAMVTAPTPGPVRRLAGTPLPAHRPATVQRATPPATAAAVPPSTGSETQLIDNYAAVLDEVLRAKPSAAKGKYLKKVTLTTTMGPGV
ncbi:hypothetical protein BSA16_00070, partial [Micromonospora sp. Rc5]